MSNLQNLALFDQQEVRRHWDSEQELWWFSVVDVVRILTNSVNPHAYWRKLKERLLNEEKSQTVTKCHALKMMAADGRMRLTDCADTQNLLRLIQSIPSPKAEPLKLWLAKVGYERLEETADPELAFERAMRTYQRKGYSKEWINQRLKSIEVRKDLTDEWQNRGINKGIEFAILTDEITKAWSDKSVKEYKQLKGLKKESLRDNMSNLEIVLNMLAEASTTEISKVKQPSGLPQNKEIAREGGHVAGVARKEIEKQTGQSVVIPQNAKQLHIKQNLLKKVK